MAETRGERWALEQAVELAKAAMCGERVCIAHGDEVAKFVETVYRKVRELQTEGQ